MGNLEFKDYFVYEIKTIDNRHKSINNYSEGFSAAENIKGICGYIDQSGQETILSNCKKVYDFHDGLARTKDKKGNYVFINKNFEEVFSCKYFYVGNFYNGLALVRNENGLFGYIDKTGKEAIPCVYKSATDFIYQDAYTGKVCSKVFSDIDGSIYVDKKGNIVENVKEKNLINKKNKQTLMPYKGINKLYGYKNQEGKIIIPPVYIEAAEFNGGFAVVRDMSEHLYFIDEKGNKQSSYSIIKIYSTSKQEAINDLKELGYEIESVKFDSYYSEIKIGDESISVFSKTETELRDKKLTILKEIKENIDDLILSVSGKLPKSKKI